MRFTTHLKRMIMFGIALAAFAAVPVATISAAPVHPVGARLVAADTNASGIQAVNNDCRPSSGSVNDLNSSNCRIVKYIVVFTNILSAVAGIIIVMMITYGGIKYSMAGANPQAVADARKIIIKAITALLLYIFGFSIVQWLVPGGLF